MGCSAFLMEMTTSHRPIEASLARLKCTCSLKVLRKVTNPHAHDLLKIHGLDRDKLIERIHDLIFKVMYEQYLLNTFSQDLPNIKFDIVVPIGLGQQKTNYLAIARTRRQTALYGLPSYQDASISWGCILWKSWLPRTRKTSNTMLALRSTLQSG